MSLTNLAEKNIFLKNRSYRSFTNKKIDKSEILKMIENARVSASARNSQSVRFAIVDSKDLCDKLFPLTKWAGSIPWNPTPEEAPTAYIVLCTPNDIPINKCLLYFDMGVASQSILLTAVDMGYGGCIIGSFNKTAVHELLNIPQNYDCEIIIALGEPDEISTVVDAVNGDIKYYRDEEKKHQYVPKLPLNELIL